MKVVSKKIMSSLLLFVLLVGVVITPVNAQDTAPFSISAVTAENQIDTKVSYFDLSMKPNQKQKIQVAITNTGDQTIVAQTKVNAASTGINGSIQYTVSKGKDKSLVYSMEDIAKVVQPEVKIKANSSIHVDIELTMPPEGYDGVILGGVLVTADYESVDDQDDQNDKDKNGIEIENKIAYVLGIKLTQTDAEVTPNMELHQIQPTTIAMRSAMTINLQNTEAIIMKNVKINAVIYKKGSNSILHKASKTDAEIAPNSNFDFSVDWENQRIEPGKYRLKMRVDYGDEFWEWDEEFEVKETDSIKVNKEAINIEEDFPYWIYISIGSIVLTGLLYFAYLLGKRRKKEDNKG